MAPSAVKWVLLLAIVFAAILPMPAQNPCNIKPGTVPGGAYKVGGEVQAPVAIATPDPEIPASAASTGLHKARLWVLLDCSGIPATVKVYAPLGVDSKEKAVAVELGTASRNAVLRWRFRPAMRWGKPILVQFDVEFTLKPQEPSTSPGSRRGSVTHSFIYTPRTSSGTTAVQ